MSNSSIAIVGMAGRFPGAPNIEAFWRNLRDGVESIRTLSDDELRAAGVSQEELENPEYVRAAAILDGLDLFDASFLDSVLETRPSWIRSIGSFSSARGKRWKTPATPRKDFRVHRCLCRIGDEFLPDP